MGHAPIFKNAVCGFGFDALDYTIPCITTTFSLSGTGTFGRVCLCRDRISEKYCAMKILAMTEVIRLKQIEHVKNERNILREIRHPFVISL